MSDSQHRRRQRAVRKIWLALRGGRSGLSSARSGWNRVPIIRMDEADRSAHPSVSQSHNL